MNQRNLIWLAVIAVIVLLVTAIASIWWGLLSGAAALVLSEIVERVARKRRGGSAGLVLPTARRSPKSR